MSNIQNVNSDQFEKEVLKAEGLVLVDFWATWCAPCKAIAPILEDISQENKNVKIVKVDADANQELVKKYGVRGIPTMMLFSEGQVQATKVGAINKAGLVNWIDMNT